MSTRANIIIQDEYDKLYFYRHYDGDPETTMSSLKEFCDMYKNQLRSNVEQSAGWLILKGAVEYGFTGDFKKRNDLYDWKVGAYEPATNIYGDIEYLYVIDLVDKQLQCYKAQYKHDETGTWGSASEALTLKQKPIEVYNF